MSNKTFCPRPVVASLKEMWRPVVGFKLDFNTSYEVSNFGNVRSIDRQRFSRKGNPYIRKGKQLKPVYDDGYQTVGMSLNGFSRLYKVHVIVAFAWIEPCPGVHGKEKGCYSIDHFDLNKKNNNAHNLFWKLAEEHAKQGLKVRGVLHGENTKVNKLSEKQVKEIRSSKLSCRTLAKQYNVTIGTIERIINGTSWMHVPYPNKDEQIKLRQRGAKNLTADQIKDIIYSKNTVSQLAAKYNLNSRTTYRIRRYPHKYLKES